MPQQNNLEFPRHFLSLKTSDACGQHFVAERNLGFDAAQSAGSTQTDGLTLMKLMNWVLRAGSR